MTTPTPAFTLPTPAAPTPAVPPPAPAAPAATEPVQISTMVDKYRRLRDKKKEISDRHKEELRPYNEALLMLGNQLLDALNRAGVESTRTSAGTVFKSIRSSYTVKDPVAFREWLEANNRFDLLETRVSKEAVESLLESGGDLPPGLGVSSDTTVNVRK